MVIGDSLGYSSLGLGSVRQHQPHLERNTVTLEAKVDPEKPNEYSVQAPKPVIAPPEKPSDVKSSSKRAPQNTDPVSRVFNAVAHYEPKIHRIDIFV